MLPRKGLEAQAHAIVDTPEAASVESSAESDVRTLMEAEDAPSAALHQGRRYADVSECMGGTMMTWLVRMDRTLALVNGRRSTPVAMGMGGGLRWA